MNANLLELLTKYQKAGILVDTNILLLYVIGSFDPVTIYKFSRTSNYTEDDFTRVSKFIDNFDIKITTPHILTEASNLIGNRKEIQAFLKTFITLSQEIFIPSLAVSSTESFLKFGLADSATVETSQNLYLTLTDDRPLYGYLINRGIDAVNLDQIRMI